MMSPGRSSLSVARDTGGGAGPASAGDAGGVDKLEGVRVLLVSDLPSIATGSGVKNAVA